MLSSAGTSRRTLGASVRCTWIENVGTNVENTKCKGYAKHEVANAPQHEMFNITRPGAVRFLPSEQLALLALLALLTSLRVWTASRYIKVEQRKCLLAE
eukprot:1139945-Pyramimonas_sp.AAC.2